MEGGGNASENRGQGAGRKDEYHVEAGPGVVEEDEDSGGEARNVDQRAGNNSD